MTEKYADQEFLEYVIKALVDHPEDIKITRKVDEMGVLMTLDLNREDMGKIIGRQGNTAKAIRTILRVVGMKNNARVNLKINEPEGSVRPAAGERGPKTASQSVDEIMNDLKQE
ncbi:MAG: KH domain-containing protein [Patescibacteria group bacterium]